MDEAKKMKNLKTKKLYIQVYEEIKKYISENELKQGDKLPTEMEMCELLGVSRNVLREAIKSLEITGVVTSKPGVGIVIREFNSDFFMSALLSHVNATNSQKIKDYIEELRRVLELSFARKAFDTIGEEELAIMSEQVEVMKQSSNTKKEVHRIAFAKADALFHKTLFSKIDNVLVSSIVDFFWAYDKYYKEKVTLLSLEITVLKHTKILEALYQKDYTAFYDAMVYHFTYKYTKK